MTFWEIDPHENDCLYQWWLLTFGLKNDPTKFQKVMDQLFSSFNIAKCYIDDIIILV
jgi:hypothetical protein